MLLTKFKSLYPWCLQETDDNGEQIGPDLIRLLSSYLNFSASDLRLVQSVINESPALLVDGEKEEKTKLARNIRANLHSDENNPRFSMFGTDRNINDFDLRIIEVGDGQKEYCHVMGVVSYSYIPEFSWGTKETRPDSIEVELGLSKEKIDELCALIATKNITRMTLSLRFVPGFYSAWSPESLSKYDCIKVLTGSQHEVEIPEGCEIEPPRLNDSWRPGSGCEFGLHLTTVAQLESEQSFKALNVAKLSEEDIEAYEKDKEEIEEPEDVNQVLLAQIARNQQELIKLKTPVWLITLFLGLLVLSVLL